MKIITHVLLMVVAGLFSPVIAGTSADILASGFFSGTLEKFDESTGAQSTFANLASASDPFPGLAGVVFDATTNSLFVTARVSNRLYSVNALTGALNGFRQFDSGTSPAGLTVDSNGNIYVARNGGNSVAVLAGFNGAETEIILPDVGVGANLPSGVAIDSQGRVLISTFAGAGVFRHDPMTNMTSLLASSPLSNSQIAIDAAGNFVVGGAAFTNDVRRFAPDGSQINDPFLTISPAILPEPSGAFTSPNFTSPSGVAYDTNGNLIVAALGRTNPTSSNDNFQNNGGLFRFDANGNLLTTFARNSTPFSSVIVFTAVPEPTSFGIIAAVAMLGMLRRKKKVS